MSKENFKKIVEEQLVDNGIDRIRQILFGEQIAEIERHFEKLEERLADETIQLRHDFNQRIDELASQLREEINYISTELEDDTRKRAELSELFASISLWLKDKPSDQDLG
jgi:hypothetical protein